LGLRLGSRFVSVGAGVELGGEGTLASPASGSPERLAPASQGDASVPSSRPHHSRPYEWNDPSQKPYPCKVGVVRSGEGTPCVVRRPIGINLSEKGTEEP
jgi:hypothetical protein